VTQALEDVMRSHLARMDQIGAKGVEVTNKWTAATATLAERFVDVGHKIAPVVLDDPKAEPVAPKAEPAASPGVRGFAV
jgi:hypothetical protein